MPWIHKHKHAPCHCMQRMKSCGAGDAELVFCPYNYLLDPVVRSSLDVDINNAVLIFDEAHNIEDTCRQAVVMCAMIAMQVACMCCIIAAMPTDTASPAEHLPCIRAAHCAA